MASIFYGAYGDMKEYGQNIAAAFCCFLCCGPILIAVGIATLVASYANNRAGQVDAYEASVDAWNADHSLEFLDQTFSFAVSGRSAVALVASLADQNVRDSSVSRTVENAILYAYDNGGDAFDPNSNPRIPLGLNLYFEGPNSSSAIMFHATPSFTPLLDQTIYPKYVPPFPDSNTNTVDCKINGAASYFGSRWNSKITCVNWCRDTLSGFWDSQFRKCVVHWAAERVSLRVEPNPLNSDGGWQVQLSGRSPSFTNEGDFDQGGAQYARERSTEDFPPSYGRVVTDSALRQRNGWPFVQYAITTTPSSYRVDSVKVELRSALDPAIVASDETKGCSSCTNTRKIFNRQSCDDRCFGLTPGELRTIAYACFGVAAATLICQCSVVYCIRKKNAEQQHKPLLNSVAVPPPSVHIYQQQQPQYPQAQPVYYPQGQAMHQQYTPPPHGVVIQHQGQSGAYMQHPPQFAPPMHQQYAPPPAVQHQGGTNMQHLPQFASPAPQAYIPAQQQHGLTMAPPNSQMF